jgi:hypothetical protein
VVLGVFWAYAGTKDSRIDSVSPSGDDHRECNSPAIDLVSLSDIVICNLVHVNFCFCTHETLSKQRQLELAIGWMCKSGVLESSGATSTEREQEVSSSPIFGIEGTAKVIHSAPSSSS